MGVSRDKFWIAGGAIVAVLILVATFALSYKPALDEASDLGEKQDLAEIHNAKLTGEIKQLRAIEARLPEIRERIAELQVGIPVAANIDEFEAYLSELILENDAYLLEITGLEARVAVPTSTQTAAPSPAPAETSTAAPEPGEVATTAAPSNDETEKPVAERVPSKVPAIEGFHVFDWTISVGGTYEQVSAILEALQTTSSRHFLVSGLEIQTLLADKAASNGLPDRPAGEVDYKISGSTYVLEGPQQPEEPKVEEPKMPSTKDDPFADVIGAK